MRPTNYCHWRFLESGARLVDHGWYALSHRDLSIVDHGWQASNTELSSISLICIPADDDELSTPSKFLIYAVQYPPHAHDTASQNRRLINQKYHLFIPSSVLKDRLMLMYINLISAIMHSNTSQSYCFRRPQACLKSYQSKIVPKPHP